MDHESIKPFYCPDPLRFFLFSALLTLLLTSRPVELNATPSRNLILPESAHDTTRQKISNEQRSKNFYDSIYRKFHRSQFAKLLYDLAFVAPPDLKLPDTVQKIRSDSPFDKYEGKVIRTITIKSLDPFGTSVVDTTSSAISGVGKALNTVHIETRAYIIRRQLLFKPGDLVDPIRFGENIRIIRDLSFISSANILISQPDPENDSVDVTVITKDVWSIGFDVPVITPNRVVFRLYDANFLGTGDRFSNTFSMEPYRAPFFRWDGASYIFSNIGGSFIDANIHFNQDDDRNLNIGGGFQRTFFTIMTRWAGGLDFEYNELVNIHSEELKDIAYYTDQNLWLGQAFLLKNRKVPTRFILSEAAYWRNFSSRPAVSVDSNSAYYNRIQTFAGFSFSRNNYYVSDYIFRFGLPENVPYGRLVQLLLGPEWNDFYSRVYAGFTLAGGDYFGTAGYFSGSFKIGGYIYNFNYEDAVMKLNLIYMSPLFPRKSDRYRFRTFFSSDYKVGFNLRTNNKAQVDLNRDLAISKIGNDSVFSGTQLLAGNLRMIMYTPWFFYGFKFGLMLHLQGGFISIGDESLFRQPFYTGIGTGILIRNDNLIFPTVTISFYIYPNHPEGVPLLQVNFLQNATYNFPDFNVSQPHAETLEN